MNKPFFTMQTSSSLWFWSVPLLLCMVMLGGALFYQYVLDTLPCELCIYVRVWVLLIAFVCLLGIALRGLVWARIALLLGMAALTYGLSQDVWVLLSIDYRWPTDGACSFVAYFPEWAPLDKWMPALFEVQDLCQPTPYLLFKISMADALAASCAVFFVLALCGLIDSLAALRNRGSLD